MNIVPDTKRIVRFPQKFCHMEACGNIFKRKYAK